MQLLYVISINLSYNHSELALLSIGEHCNTLFVMLLLVGQFVYFRLSPSRHNRKESEGLKWGTLRAGINIVVCCWIFCAFFAALFFKENVPNPRRNTLLPLPSASFTHFMKPSITRATVFWSIPCSSEIRFIISALVISQF